MVMAVLPFPEALVLFISSDAAAAAVGPSKEFHWLASVFSGIIMCTIVYKFTRFISFLCFKGYGKLSKAQKVEWNNRGISTIHALIVASASLYLLLWSGLFDEDSQDESIVNRSSVLSNFIFGISIGYFLSDLSMILWCFPALGGLEDHNPFYKFEMVSGQCSAGQKNSKLYICNGVMLFLVWLAARVLLFGIFYSHMIFHFDQVKQIFPLGFYSLLVVPALLAIMNCYWFWKIF